MIAAISPKDGSLILCSGSGQRAICPACREEVVGKHGDVVAPHFAHRGDSGCTHGQGETDWHYGWKKLLSKNGWLEEQAVARVSNPERQHFADAARGDQVIEIQRRWLRGSEVRSRCETYGPGLVWIVDARREGTKNLIKRGFRDGEPRRWCMGNLFSFVADTDVPVVVDFGTRVEVWVGLEVVEGRNHTRALSVARFDRVTPGEDGHFLGLFSWLDARRDEAARKGWPDVIDAELDAAFAAFHHGAKRNPTPTRGTVLLWQLRELLDPMSDAEVEEYLADGVSVSRWLGGYVSNDAAPVAAGIARYRLERFDEQPEPGSEDLADIEADEDLLASIWATAEAFPGSSLEALDGMVFPRQGKASRGTGKAAQRPDTGSQQASLNLGGAA